MLRRHASNLFKPLRSLTLSAMRVLVVEDDSKIASFVVRGLKQAGYAVDHAPDGETGLALVESTDYDAAIVDIMLPKLDGISLVKRMRAARRPTPVLFLSARSSVDDRVKGLQAGGDDYLTKPFGPRELVARVKALIRRSEETQEEEVFKVGSMELDLGRYTVSIRKRAVELTTKELDLLKALVLAKGRALTREFLLDRVWGYERASEIESRTVDVHVRRLREKLGPEATRIVTVKNVGYRFDQDT